MSQYESLFYPPYYTPFRGQSGGQSKSMAFQGQIHPPARCGENNTPQISFTKLSPPPLFKNISRSPPISARLEPIQNSPPLTI